VSYPAKPHPNYPAGCEVRVRSVEKSARPERARLAGRVGRVTSSSTRLILVMFDGVAVGEFFTPHRLERVDGEPAAA